ncbi:MAG: glycosyltransferase family 39 protein [Candidatus Parcubacteria bacterium]|nr:glycosyltransferase family 39 protein [Candidatus Parcubacteria bacterium]
MKILLLTTLLLGFFLRIYGLNWDQGFHLHPDERAITMFSLPLAFPSSISEFLSPSSTLNPHFFAYGSFPLYLLKTAGEISSNFTQLASRYDSLNLIGRFLSALFDTGTIFILFLLGKKLFSKQIGLLAAFFYTVSVLPIQTSHFYAVDIPLTFFILLTLYILINFYEKPSKRKAIIIGILFGISLATKTSALALIASIGISLLSDFLLIFLKSPHHPRTWITHIPKLIKTLFAEGLIITVVTLISFIFFEPYAIIAFQEFWQQTLQQSQMTHDAFIFPYTLQYVGKIPYLYELKNIFFWGQGPILATLSFSGIFYLIFIIIKKQKEKRWAQELILLIFFLSYFVIVGKFSVGWMRYMLPLYPILCLSGAVLIHKIYQILKTKIRSHFMLNALYLILYTSVLVWPFSFINIYAKPNARVLASNWISQNIPAGSILAVEHWDDSLPLFGQQNYKMITLPLYDPDSTQKWESINQQLSQTDYIILASNRLYSPLMRLTDCKTLPIGRCYTQTSQYYGMLFDGSLGFKKIAEFSIYPTIPFINLPINDQNADESFTVYDHPKVTIFQRIP